MSLQLCSINSGSNANCYYVGHQNTAVLIDAGLSCRETERRIKKLDLNIAHVKAIVISHEHSDHIAGMAGLSKKFQIPVYITEPTFRQSNMPVEPHLLRHFKVGEALAIGDLQIQSFRKHHDAVDACSFVVHGHNTSVGIFTDIGHACPNLIEQFQQCHAIFLESNYCESMLSESHYPPALKRRISGNSGHLSNNQALDLFVQHRPAHLQLLVLAHLSKNNNHPSLVHQLFAPHAGKTQIVVASRYEASEIFNIHATGEILPSSKKKWNKRHLQLSLFDA
jgi:phosphoribosyl 1,2-cyclic phosphodiesterase